MGSGPKPQDTAEQVLASLRAQVPDASTLVVGVSGGLDSVALLHAVCQGWPEASRRVLAVHVNHGLRGSAAQSDQRLVEAFCRRLGVACRVFHPKVRVYARQQKLSLEEAGRKLRQESFMEAARAARAKAVVVAHHRDDQAETLLLNLLRGTAAKGLSGMLPARAFPHPQAPRGLLLLRPCLSLSKRDLQAYALKHRLRWREDASNRDPGFTRNRLRKTLLPLLEKKFNPDVRSALARTAACAARDEAFLDAWAEKASKNAGWSLERGQGRLDIKKLRRLDPALRFRIFSRLWDQMKIPDKTHRHLSLLESRLSAGSGSWDLPGGWRVALIPPTMTFRRVRIGRPAAGMRHLNPKPPGGVQTQTCSVPEAREMPKHGSDFVFMDARKVTQPLRVRLRRPGDRMRPLGLSGKSREIKKILADMKAPLAQRRDWPMVVMGAEIVWVYLGPVSETVKLDADSQQAIRVWMNPAGRVCKPQARTRRRVPRLMEHACLSMYKGCNKKT